MRRTALRLTVMTRATLADLRNRGRIAAYHVKRRNRDRGGNNWWFYWKDDVYGLLADGEYLRRRDCHGVTRLRSLGRWDGGAFGGQ